MFVVLIFFIVLAFILFNDHYNKSEIEPFYYRNPWYPYASYRYDPYIYNFVRPYYFSGCMQNLFGGISCGPFSFLYY